MNSQFTLSSLVTSNFDKAEFDEFNDWLVIDPMGPPALVVRESRPTAWVYTKDQDYVGGPRMGEFYVPMPNWSTDFNVMKRWLRPRLTRKSYRDLVLEEKHVPQHAVIAVDILYNGALYKGIPTGWLAPWEPEK